MKVDRKSWIIILFSVVFPLLSFAQIVTKKVTFPAGKSATTISSTLTGDQIIDYAVSASENQTLKATLKVQNTSCYFNVLPPGSNDEAIFIGSSEGNSFSGSLSKSGVYKIRVYLMRNEARRGTKVNFTLNIGVTGQAIAVSKDVKVPGTKYHATGELKVVLGAQKNLAKFGVIRYSGGKAEVHATVPGGLERVFMFSEGEWVCKTADCKIKYTKNSDEWEITVNDYEHYFISDAVIFGG